MHHNVFRLANGKTVALRAADGRLIQLNGASAALQLEWVSNPTLTGTGKVGSTLTVGAGVYHYLDRVQRDLIRVRGDETTVVVSGIANGATYTVAAVDDGASLQVREVAEGGTTVLTSYSTAKAITYTAPALSSIPDLGPYTQGSGNQTVDLTVYATGDNLTWTLSGSSTASLDAATGLLSIPTVTLQAGVSATVTISNSGGSAQRTFTVTVAVAAPTVDASVTWLPLSYDQGSGTRTFDASGGFLGANRVYSLISPPAGVTINSSTGVISTTTASLLSATTVTIRATNAGGYAQRTLSVAVVVVTGTPPTLSGTAIPNRLDLIRGTAATTQATAFAFSGSVTSYAVIGTFPGVTINSSTGVLTFAKTATFAQQTVTVRASNSAGSVDATFQVSCIMQVLAVADVTISWRTDKTGASDNTLTPPIPVGFFTWHFDVRESSLPETVTALWWRPDAHVAGQGPGTGYHPCIRLNPQPTGLPAGVARWVARRCTPVTGAPMLRDWLDVVRSGVVGQSRTHNFIWSASSVILNPLTAMEFSGPVAADITQDIALTGAPAFTRAPKIGRNRTCTISNASPAVVTLNAHAQANDDLVQFSTNGTLPAPLAAATDYYVINKATNTFQVSATSGGTAIATTTAGSGTHTLITPATTAAVGTVLSVIDGKVTGDPAPTITRRLLLGTTAKTSPYTIVSGDAGNFTAENTATSTGGAVTTKSDAITIGGSSDVVFATIGTIAELNTAITNCPGGQVILCKPGVYWGRINRVSNVNKSPNIIIRAQDYANPPEFRGSNYTATSNTDDAYQGPFNFETCSGITLDGLYCFSDRRDWRNGPGRSEDFAYDLKPKDPRQPAAAGNWGPFAIRFYNGCSNVKVTDCLIEGYPGAIYFQADTKGGTTNGEICYNTIRKSTIDHIRIYGQLTNVSVHHNKAFDCAIPANNPSNSWQVDPNRHRDFCQMASGQSLTVDMYDNWFRCEFDSNMHGPFAFAERIFNSGLDFATYSHKKVSVLRNYFEGCNFQCITVGGVDDMTVSGNLIQLGESTDDPEIYFLAPTVANPSAKAGNNIKISNNVVPLRSGQSAIRYGPGGTTGMNGTAIATNVTISAQIAAPHVRFHTLKPVGWDSWDASTVGKTGVTERVGRLAPR